MRFNAFRIATIGCVCVVAVACLAPGCKPSAKREAERQQQLAREMDKLAESIGERQAQGKLADALALAEQGLAKPQYAAQKSRFFALKFDLLLAQNSGAAAGDMILAAWKAEPALAQPYFEKLFSHYQQKTDHAAALAWCARIIDPATGLSPELRALALQWHLSAALATRDVATVQASADQVLASFAPPDAAALLLPALGGLVDSGQHALAALVAQHIGERKDLAAPCRDVVAMVGVRCLLAASDWDKLTPAFIDCAAQLPDEALLKTSRQTFLALQKANRAQQLELLSNHVVFNAPAKTNSVNFASRLWLECGAAQSKALVPQRLEALLSAQLSPVQVGSLYDRYFYELVDNVELVRSMCALGERILASCSDENTVNNVKVKILDGAFLAENYDLAVQMLEQGIPGKDKTWHDMSIPKVKAHRALAQKNPREAVKYFREFMNAWITSKQEEEYDPTSGVAYSREWILGRNAKRIAGILDSIPDKEEADKARAEAKAYFKVAVEKAKADAEATRLIKEETKDMGL
jgi:hypothetical protein